MKLYFSPITLRNFVKPETRTSLTSKHTVCVVDARLQHRQHFVSFFVLFAWLVSWFLSDDFSAVFLNNLLLRVASGAEVDFGWTCVGRKPSQRPEEVTFKVWVFFFLFLGAHVINWFLFFGFSNHLSLSVGGFSARSSHYKKEKKEKKEKTFTYPKVGKCT